MISKQRRGYILVMVLVTLIIVITALTSVATKSLRTSQQAGNAASMLQQRWGMTTCKNMFLPNAGRTFLLYEQEQLAKTKGSPGRTNVLAESVMLGGQRFDMVLSDENAKVNLNTMYHLGGPKSVGDAVKTIGGLPLQRSMSPRPAVPPTNRFQLNASKSGGSDASGEAGGPNGSADLAQSALPAFRSWGEIFDLGKMKRESPDGILKFDFTKSLTLWGNGQVNIRRATNEVIGSTLEAVMTKAGAKSLLSELNRTEEVDLQAIVETKLTRPSDRRAVMTLIGMSSFSFSLFVDVDAPQGRSRRLFVSTTDIDGSPTTTEFVFH